MAKTQLLFMFTEINEAKRQPKINIFRKNKYFWEK